MYTNLDLCFSVTTEGTLLEESKGWGVGGVVSHHVSETWDVNPHIPFSRLHPFGTQQFVTTFLSDWELWTGEKTCEPGVVSSYKEDKFRTTKGENKGKVSDTYEIELKS